MNHWRLNVIAAGGEGWGVGGATSEGRGERTGSPPIRAQADRSSVLHPQPWGEGHSPVDVGVQTWRWKLVEILLLLLFSQ